MFCNFIKFKQNKKSLQIIFVKTLNVPDMIRTRGLLVRSQTLYPAELQAHTTNKTKVIQLTGLQDVRYLIN